MDLNLLCSHFVTRRQSPSQREADRGRGAEKCRRSWVLVILPDPLDQAILDSFLDLWLPVSIGTPCALASLCWVFCHLQLAEP